MRWRAMRGVLFMSEATLQFHHEVPSSRSTAAETRVVGPPSILIIDDEMVIRESLEALLIMEGFQVTLASDGPAGLDFLSHTAFDLLLLDLALPGESGIELLPRILEMQPDLPVIMITVGQREAAGRYSRGDWATSRRGRSCSAEARFEAAVQL
jgi:CheY-like chemotaxis protein